MAAGKVRLREASPTANGAGATPPVALKPLRVSGLVVSKAEVVEALRVYVPGLVDLSVTEDGEFFWLMLGEGGAGEGQTQG